MAVSSIESNLAPLLPANLTANGSFCFNIIARYKRYVCTSCFLHVALRPELQVSGHMRLVKPTPEIIDAK
jgi:hypothetical protein